MAEVVRTLIIRNRVEGAQDVRSLADSYAAVATSSERLARATLSLTDSQLRQQRVLEQAARTQQSFAAANDNLARSTQAANDESRSFFKSLTDGASGLLETVTHLKLLAVAAYAMSPAFRAVVASGVATSLGVLGVSAGVASQAMGRLVAFASPALSFLARLTIPLGTVVAAFKLFNDTIERGSQLLEKYGGVAAQRKMFGADINDALAKLTRFQDADLSAQQVQYATALGARLETARGTIAEFLKVQLDLTDPALKLQNAWAVIVESLAKALTLAGQIPTAFANAAQAIGNSSIWNKLNFGINLPGASPDQIIGRMNAQLNAQNGAVELSAEQAMSAARARLAAGMGGGFAGRFNQSIADLANPPKPEAPEAAKADAWTRYTEQVTKATAALTANAQTVGLGAQAHEQLRIQLQGEAILGRDGVKDTDERRAALQKLAEAAGAAALAFEKAKIANKIEFDRKTAFLSEEDVSIARQLQGIYGNDIPAALASSEAAAMRLNNQLKSVNSIIRDSAENFTKGFVSNLMQGKSAMDSMVLSARNLSQSLANQAITEAFKGNFLSAAVSGIGALVSGIFGKKQTSEERRAIIQQQQQLAEEQARVAQAAADEQIRIAKEAADEQARVAKDAAAEQLRIANELHERQTSFQDRLFAAANDNTTLAGQLAAFDRQANREREQEAIAGNGAMIDLEAALAFERTRIQTDFNRQAVEAEQQAARQREDAINSAAKNILDYVQGLLAGPNSTLSPQQRFANAQSAYNTKLAAAIGGDVNAQSSITSDADNLLKAARDIYASSQTFQDLQQTVISQLLSLPAVSSTTDPLLQEMRNVLGAINAGNATQALDSTLKGVLASAINAGNADATAAALSNSALFQSIAGNTGNSISLDQMRTALGGMVNNAALVSMFTRLDTDNSGLVTAAELTAQRTGFITFNTDNAGGLNRSLGNIGGATVGVENQTTATTSAVGVANQTLTSIKALQLTAAQQLELLNFQLTGGTAAITLSAGGIDRFGNATPGISGSVNNNLITALNKIVINTKLIADNTSYSATHIFAVGGSQNLGSPNSGIGTYAVGGVAPPFSSFIYGEHHPQGPFFGRAGTAPVPIFPGSPSNDNNTAELRALKAEVVRLGEIIAGSNARVAQAVAEVGENIVDEVADQTNALASQQRQSDRQRKVA